MELSQTSAFLLSLAIEAFAASLLMSVTRWAPPWRGILAAVTGTCITHPFVWHGVNAFADRWGYWNSVVAAEIFAVVVEAIVWKFAAALDWQRAFICASVANAASFGFGLALYFLL